MTLMLYKKNIKCSKYESENKTDPIYVQSMLNMRQTSIRHEMSSFVI